MPSILNLLKLRRFANAGDAAAEVAISSDTEPRLRIDAGGKLTWGAGGVSAGDTTLYRSTANTLKTDDYLIAEGGLTVKTIEIDPAGATSNQVLAFNGTKFAPANASGGGSSVTISDTAPSSPSAGNLWFESDTGKTFIYYDSAWVELNGGTLSSTFTSDTAPASPTVGSLWYETDSGALYVYYDSQWVEVGPGAVYDQILGSIQAKGDLIVGTASQAVSRQAVGSNGQKLVADSSTSTGVAWVSDTTNTAVDAKGDLLVGASDNVLARLPVSTTNGSVLVADSTATNGLSWQTQGVNVRNLLYNGAMQISQRGTSTTSITSSSYNTADRWKLTNIGAGTWTQDIQNDAPTGSGFRRSFRVLCTTADASLASSDELDVRQTLEGQDLQALRKGTANAQSLTLSFWVKSNVTGTYVAWLYDGDNARHVGATYTISSSGTWEQKTITFPADASGVLDNDSNGSLIVAWSLAAGSSFTSGTLPTSAWAAYSAANQSPGQVNLASATNNYWQMTGAQLTVGSIAQPFEFKSYETELRECQRYYWTDFPNLSFTALGFGGAGFFRYHGVYDGYWAVLIAFPNTMRATPSMDFTSWTTTNTGIGVGGQFTAHAPGIGDTNAKIYTMTSAGATVGYNSRSSGVHGTVFFGARASAEL